MKFGKRNAMQFVLACFVTTAILPSAQAFSHFSSCNLKAGQSNIQGNANKSVRFPLASVSKVFTAMWAIDKLGINYRYQTKFHITRVGNDGIDIHIEGSRDPIFGRHAAYFIISELIKRGYNTEKIEKLTFDENLLVGWNLEEKGAADNYIAGDTTYFKSLEEQTAAVKASLEDGIGTPIDRVKYTELRKDAAIEQIEMVHPKDVKTSIRKVEFKAKADFQKTAETITLTYRSTPLHKIIKNMNNWSNNYIADHLFWNLGGAPAFKTYIKNTMGFDESMINFYIGSGNNAGYIIDRTKNYYNEGTCETVVKTVARLHSITNASGLRLTDVMAVAKEDSDSTLKNFVGIMEKAVIAKTGTVNVAKTLAGAASTNNGIIYFSILYKSRDIADAHASLPSIKKEVIDLINKNGGAEQLNYTKILPLPFDKNSALTEAGPTAGKG
ncbi:D-alanyl-D-alanine carboxypeptidase [Bdellovibrio bacteriovorus]